MTNHVILVTFTQQGLSNIKTAPERLERLHKTCAEFNINISSIHMLLSQYDALIHVSSDGDEPLAKLRLHLGEQGYSKVDILRTFDEEQVKTIISKLP
jgi:uncharacterized protein with GYD domain